MKINYILIFTVLLFNYSFSQSYQINNNISYKDQFKKEIASLEINKLLEIKKTRFEIEKRVNSVYHSIPEFERNFNNTFKFNTEVVTITENQKTKLDELYNYLAQNPDKKIIINGYSVKTHDYNLDYYLSANRTFAIKTHLLMKGIHPKRMIANKLASQINGNFVRIHFIK